MKLHNVETFFKTARERYLMLERRRAGHPPPWTADEVFGEYRFCNVFREDDKVTTWFRENIRTPLGYDHVRQLRAAVAFRWFNKIETGELLKPFLLGTWDTEEVRSRLGGRVWAGLPILNGAYMIKSPPGKNKVDGLLECIDKVFQSTDTLVYWAKETNKLEALHRELCEFDYLGPFMAYQIVCDLRFTPLLANAVDVDTWTAPGPGSARGMGRIMHANPLAYRYSSKRDIPVLIERMQDLLLYSRNSTYWPKGWPKWELSTVQHWLCEYDKYMREINGEGSPKQRYVPAQ